MKRSFLPILLTLTLALLLPSCSGASPTAPSSGSGTSADPNQVDLVISSTNAFVDAAGAYRLVGEIVNNGTVPATSIEITLVLQDANGGAIVRDENGDLVESTLVAPLLTTLVPGQTSPFVYTIEDVVTVPETYTATVSSFQAMNYETASLEFHNVQIVADGYGWLYLSGVLVNMSDQWARIDSLAGGILTESGEILSAYGSENFATLLAPAGDENLWDRTPFMISIPDPGEGATRSIVYWDAGLVPAVTPLGIDLTVTNTYFDQYGSFHVVGWARNNEASTMNALIVAGLYGSDDTALDAAWEYVPAPILPGASVPFQFATFESVQYNQEVAARVNSFSVQVDDKYTTLTSTAIVSLEPAEEQLSVEGSAWSITGNFINTSGEKLESATVVVAILDADLNLVATESAYIPPTGTQIGRGDTYSYDLRIYLDPTLSDTTGFTTRTWIFGKVK